MKKKLYHVLVLPDNKGSYKEEVYEAPFDFAPIDTVYGIDFDMAIYLDASAGETMDDVDFIMTAGCAAMLIARKTGLRFNKNKGETHNTLYS
jgi:hypothetical protein